MTFVGGENRHFDWEVCTRRWLVAEWQDALSAQGCLVTSVQPATRIDEHCSSGTARTVWVPSCIEAGNIVNNGTSKEVALVHRKRPDSPNNHLCIPGFYREIYDWLLHACEADIFPFLK